MAGRWLLPAPGVEPTLLRRVAGGRTPVPPGWIPPPNPQRSPGRRDRRNGSHPMHPIRGNCRPTTDTTLNPAAWVQVTTSRDVVAHVICGTVTHFSQFALMEHESDLDVNEGI